VSISYAYCGRKATKTEVEQFSIHKFFRCNFSKKLIFDFQKLEAAPV
jgi:hypothetical protein